jgi:hypothetical protein
MNRLITFLALLAAAFPFAALGYKLFQVESTTTAIVFVLVVAGFIAVALVGPRAGLPAEATDDGTGHAPRPPAPPVTWSWDGVDRQPGEEEVPTNGPETGHTHH